MTLSNVSCMTRSIVIRRQLQNQVYVYVTIYTVLQGLFVHFGDRSEYYVEMKRQTVRNGPVFIHGLEYTVDPTY